jgi:hypothetical protein
LIVNVSSNWTLFLKWFLPVFWASFFGVFTAVVFLAFPFENTGPFRPWMVKLLTVSFYVSSLFVLYLLFMRIKRVDFGDTHFYVSDYFRTFRYTYDSVEKVVLGRGLLLPHATVHFRAPSSFGPQITFLTSHRLEEFLAAFPEVAEVLMVEDRR